MVSILPLLIAFLPHAIAIAYEKRDVSDTVFNNLVRYTKFASAAFQASCPKPLGNTLVLQISNDTTSIHGFIAEDVEIALAPLVSPGVSGGSARVHTGFLSAWNSVANQVISTVKSQLDTHPDYKIVTTGHSLGGALSSLAGLSMKSNFPNNNVQLYTFGQPRTGDATYAALVDNTLGVNDIFRGVHTYDGAVTAIPQSIGYKHHSTEYWNFVDPATPATTRQCAGDEDPTCSDSIPSTGLNLAHLFCFNQAMGLDPMLC